MTRFIKLLVVFILGLSFQALAADPIFVVFYNSGKAVKVVGDKNVILKKGEHLDLKDHVSVPDKTQLVLVCNNSTVVQLTKKGKHSIKSLMAGCNKKEVSASSAYFKYIWNSFAHKHIAPEKEPRKYMKTYGAASRGKGALVSKLVTDTINYYNGALSIAWTPSKNLITQFYKDSQNGDEILFSKPSKYIKIDSIALKLAPGNYYWDVAGEQSARRNYLKIWTKERYEEAVTKILRQIVAASPAEKAYLTGYVFEEKHFLVEAHRFYKKALLMQPTNQIYIDAVSRF